MRGDLVFAHPPDAPPSGERAPGLTDARRPPVSGACAARASRRRVIVHAATRLPVDCWLSPARHRHRAPFSRVLSRVLLCQRQRYTLRIVWAESTAGARVVKNQHPAREKEALRLWGAFFMALPAFVPGPRRLLRTETIGVHPAPYFCCPPADWMTTSKVRSVSVCCRFKAAERANGCSETSHRTTLEGCSRTSTSAPCFTASRMPWACA